MNEENFNFEKNKVISLKDIFFLLRNNWQIITIILIVSFIVAGFYAYKEIDIYQATTSMKISQPKGNILESQFTSGISDFGNDRFIANEIEIIKSYSIRSRTAKVFLDSFYVSTSKEQFYSIFDRESVKHGNNVLLTVPQLAGLLSSIVDIKQKTGLDIVEISAESPAPFEAALIANIYSSSYRIFNLEANRDQLTVVREFLEKQRDEKQLALNNAEDDLSNYQKKGGIIALDAQAQNLILQLANFQAQRDAANIDLQATRNSLTQLKSELAKQDPKLAGYLESLSSGSYVQALRDEIAKLQVNKDLAMADNNNSYSGTALTQDYDQKINELKAKLNDKISVVKAGIMASSPAEIKDLTQKILDSEVKVKSLEISQTELNKIVGKYESRFNKLPETSIAYARYEREREASEKLYSLVEEKYQEALINEQSQPGNVLIIDTARRPELPSKPNRILIILIGLLIGGGLGFIFISIKESLDNTIKTPEDIEKKDINVLAWIPEIEGLKVKGNKELEFIVSRKSDAVSSEAFRALRTRVQFSKIGPESTKTILVTSAAPGEGKTIVSVNLAGTFALNNKKTLLLDTDLRKPRIHSIFKVPRYPGLVDYLFGKVSLDEIVRKSDEMENLYFITTGTIPPNPSEMLDSNQMDKFLSEMRRHFDIIILDSAPIIAVTDSEILSRKVDATILVTAAEQTEFDMLEKAAQSLKNNNSSFIGTVLNRFTYKSGYGSYYKYYYYYSQPTNGNGKKFKQEILN